MAPLPGAATREALTPLPDDPATRQRRFARLGVQDRHRHPIRSTVAGLSLPDGQVDPARALARELTRTGTSAATVTAGLALLSASASRRTSRISPFTASSGTSPAQR